MGYPERLLGPDEHLVLTLRPHVKALLRPLLVLLVAAPATGFLIGMVPDSPASSWLRLGVLMLAAVAIGRWVVIPFLLWFTTLYVITDRRLVTRHGVVGRTGHDLPWTRLGDVHFTRGVVDRVLGCGTLVVESVGGVGRLVLDDVPRVEQVQRALYGLSDDLREQLPDDLGPLEDDDDFDDLLAEQEEVEAPTLVLDRRRGRAR